MNPTENTDPSFNDLRPEEESSLYRSDKREEIRSIIATAFVCGYLAIVVFLIVLNTFFDLGSESVKDYLLAIGSPLGFVIGFYFKTTTSGQAD